MKHREFGIIRSQVRHSFCTSFMLIRDAVVMNKLIPFLKPTSGLDSDLGSNGRFTIPSFKSNTCSTNILNFDYQFLCEILRWNIKIIHVDLFWKILCRSCNIYHNRNYLWKLRLVYGKSDIGLTPTWINVTPVCVTVHLF